jgi:sigma54-dependent transcription regulator
MLAAGGTVKEAAVLDPSARIASIRVTRSDASGAFVEADVTTARGSYVATFHVTTATTGGTIDQHDYIKV